MTTTTPERTARVSRTGLFAGLFAAALLIAAGLSYFASSHPDGLEHVAESTGFGHAAEDSASAGSPFADYATAGIDNAWLSGAISGVVGIVVVLLIGLGIAYAVRRRGADTSTQQRG